MTNSEKVCNIIAEQFMLGDFTFQNLQVIVDGNEIEICDCLVEYHKYYLVFQIKEREVLKQTEDIQKWLEKKVYKKAINQMTKSIDLIQKGDTLKVKDKHGNDYIIESSKECIPIIVFDNNAVTDYSRIYESKRIGIVNVFSLSDFEKALNMLFLPSEIIEYIQQRQKLFYEKGVPDLIIGEREDGATLLVKSDTEEDVVAFYQEFLGADNSQKMRQSCADFMKLLHLYFDKQIEKQKNYKEIVSRLSLLPRIGIMSFMERMRSIIDIAQNKKTIVPYRLVIRNIDFGILFYPVVAIEELMNIEFLGFLCDLFLQDCQLKGLLLNKVILVVAYYHLDGSENPIQLNWIYRENSNLPDEQLTDYLKKDNPWDKK